MLIKRALSRSNPSDMLASRDSILPSTVPIRPENENSPLASMITSMTKDTPKDAQLSNVFWLMRATCPSFLRLITPYCARRSDANLPRVAPYDTACREGRLRSLARCNTRVRRSLFPDLEPEDIRAVLAFAAARERSSSRELR